MSSESPLVPKDQAPPIRLAFTVADTDAEGPGLRFALWVQGCSLACPGCCNLELWPASGGHKTSATELLAELDRAVERTPDIEGVSLLGGEPYEQDLALLPFVEGVRARGLSVMIYSGFERAELEAMNSPLTALADLIVAGRYKQEQRTTSRRWIGSENQELIFLSDRYQPDQPCFSEPNHAEIRYNSEGELTVVGFPFESVLKAFPKKRGHFDV
ncbi:MAG: radical SAM protein [Myxococcales bacterium]|nr:radical SAM protein [Myxococcales bacterium]